LLPNSSPPSRALLCDGCPLGCDFAIVGANPATNIPLWPYWNAKSGCDKEKWLEALKKRTGGRLPPTRKRIEWLLEEIRPHRCLELNVYPYISKKVTMLQKELKDTEVFEYLLTTIKPRLLFVFGNPAIKEVSKLKSLGEPALVKGEFSDCALQDAKLTIYADSHVFNWSQCRTRELGCRFKKRLDNLSKRDR
jgi:hypothetical protein